MEATLPDFRIIPSIEQLRQRPRVQTLLHTYGHAAVVRALREETDTLRARLAMASDDNGTYPALPASVADAIEQIEAGLGPRLQGMFRSTLRPVINATGVVIHTNLGRSPLAPQALRDAEIVATRYSTLEYDLDAGRRGHRDVHAEALLCQLTGAEAAVVVNNCAAATMVMLAALAAGREVIVSRGELVEIGGGFRVPDVMAQSGAILREVGTTNRTRAADYAAALTDRTALLLRVHRSNFRIEGFTEAPTLEELVALGRARGVPVAEDLGSGNLIGGMVDGGQLGDVTIAQVPGLEAVLRGEPTVQGSLTAGVDVLCVSGDKLLGGPQAGIILGRRAHVDAIRRHPLLRALRVDKLTYGALTGTLVEYASGRAAHSIPIIRMLTRTPGEIEARAVRLAERLTSSGLYSAETVDGTSTIGGGTTPGATLPTRLLAIVRHGLSADALETAMRTLDPPVIARIVDDRVVLDLRTVLEDEDDTLARILRGVA